MTVENATPSDAPGIAAAILMALGEETCREFASGALNMKQLHELFTRCAASDDSQYSWRNTVVARDSQGDALGYVVSYDGARLAELRKRFLDEFADMAGYRIDRYMTDETTPDEWYLDSIAVMPEARGNGVAKALIKAVRDRAAASGKPVGLLVDKSNDTAQAVYEALGFQPDGERPFAGEMMFHRILKPKN